MTVWPSGRRRCFLFLQGLAGSFFSRLGAALVERGNLVHRINFNGGDALFWRLPGAIDYRGSLDDWPAFLDGELRRLGVTDILLFGDCRPLHREAIRLAGDHGIRVFVFEEGYLRPNWITMEEGGVNGNSSLPRQAAYYRRTAPLLPEKEDGLPLGGNFTRRAVEDVAYHLTAAAMRPRFRRYRRHAPWPAFVEYAGWIGRFLYGLVNRGEPALPAALGERPYYLLPLQLDSDYQVRVHSRFVRIRPALREVLGSFARHAPPEALLVVKRHPLDNGLTNWGSVTRAVARAAGIEQRVIYLDHPDLAGLIQGSRGVVTINSTVGALALQLQKPVVALGQAVYDIDGLTFQGGLDAFWRGGEVPDPHLFAAFRRVLVNTSLIRGSFFTEEGLAAAVAEAVARLEAAVAPTRRAQHGGVAGTDRRPELVLVRSRP